jgi:histidinol-phosphate aminotransferase
MHDFSRRHFARLLGAGTAAAAFPSALAQVLLNSNENPYGPSPAAMRAMRDALDEVFRYPDAAERELAAAVAKLHGVSTDELLLGNGSSDILRLVPFAFPGKIVTATPTFEVVWLHARPGSEVVKVPLDAAHAHDLEKMLDAARDAALVYVCNPNNPTATITAKSRMRAFLDALPKTVTVLVDEAYHEYADSPDYESVIPLVASTPNLVVARTFSKIHALAGLRIGYAVAQKPMIGKLAAQQQFNVMNLLGCIGAAASLADSAHLAAARKKNSDMRAWLARELDVLGYSMLPSHANFVMIDMRREVKPLLTAFRERGVRVARLFPAVPQHMRVTLGTPSEMRRFIEVLKAVR